MKKSALSILLASCVLHGAALAVVDEGVKMDWSDLKLKSFGTGRSEPNADATSDLKSLERAAWNDGFRRIEAFYASQAAFANLDKKTLRELVRQHTQSTNTTYFAYGSVRVYFETPYAKVFPSHDLALKSDGTASAPTRSSGLVFKVSGTREPSAVYRVVAEGSGETLFSLQNVSKEAFSKNLMGRWLSPSAKKTLSAVAGDSPETLDMSQMGADLVVSKDAWQKALDGNKALLHEARIAIVVQPR